MDAILPTDGFTIDLSDTTQVLTVELDGTIEAKDLRGISKMITVKGLNTGQMPDDIIDPLVINVNFIECPEVTQTAC